MGEENNKKKTFLELFLNGTIEEFKDAIYAAEKLKDGEKEEESFNLKQKCLLTFDKIKFEEMKKQTELLEGIRDNLEYYE